MSGLNKKFSRRTFLRTMGTASAGLLVAPYISSSNIFAYGREDKASYLAKVGITNADNYERSFIKQKVQYLFEAIDGITDVVKAGDKVGIKINLTGSSGYQFDPKLKGKAITETMWTHPEVLRAVGELLIDSGVKGSDIYIVEALGDDASFNNFGYLDVQQGLGANMIDLNKPDPYTDFAVIQGAENGFNFNSFKVNQILNEIDVYVSIPKMKQHYEAGVTCSLKNQVGMVPKQLYMLPSVPYRREAIHSTNGGSSKAHLPRSICDLNRARPVNLAVVDGIMNARGGEGVWNSTFVPHEDHVLLAGKNPIATDSIAAYIMGNDPEAEKLNLPDKTQCDNYLYLLNQLGEPTNQMNEIEVVGDGAGLITSAGPKYEVIVPSEIQLLQNFPNPFNPSTVIRFYLPSRHYVTVKVFDAAGREVETLMKGDVPAGQHEFHWRPDNLASGIYIYVLQADGFRTSRKMIYQK